MSRLSVLSPMASFLVAAAAVVLPSSASASLELAQKSTCTACHAMDRKLVGPSFQAIAQRHAAAKTTTESLAASIRTGGAGKWGPVPMPAQPGLNEADALTLATWIMGGAK